MLTTTSAFSATARCAIGSDQNNIVAGRSFVLGPAEGDPVAHAGEGLWCWERIADGYRLVGGPFETQDQGKDWMRSLASGNRICGHILRPVEGS